MTKADIVERVHQRIGLSKKESAEIGGNGFGIVKNNPGVLAKRFKICRFW